MTQSRGGSSHLKRSELKLWGFFCLFFVVVVVFCLFSFFGFFLFCFFVLFFLSQGLLCVALEPVLDLAFVDQAKLELTEICLCLCLCLPSAGIKGVRHHHLVEVIFFHLKDLD